MIRINLWRVNVMSEDKQNVKADEETKHIDLDGICAAGMIEPLLNRPLWNGHRYAKMDNWKELYCPTHYTIYQRIEKQKKLNNLDGQ